MTAKVRGFQSRVLYTGVVQGWRAGGVPSASGRRCGRPPFSFLMVEARFMGRYREDVVAVSCALANRCVVAGAVEELAAQGALRVLGKECNGEEVLEDP